MLRISYLIGAQLEFQIPKVMGICGKMASGIFLQKLSLWIK